MNRYAKTLRRGALLALALCAPLAARAAYPDHPVTWVVPYPPGGTTDAVARDLAQALGKVMKASIVVENKAGAGGQIAMSYVARSAPNGYTLLVSDASLATAPSLYRSMPVDPLKDLEPVALFVTVPNVLVVNPKVPAHSLAELIALTRKEPGKFNFSSGGVGSPLHLAGEALRLQTGLKWTHVPYKGAGPAIMAVISGEAQIATPSLPAAVPQIQSGRLRALAVTSPKRVAALPGVPSVVELGYPKAIVFGWVGLHAPAGTPPAVLRTWETATARVLKDPKLVKQLRSLGADVDFQRSAQYGKLVTREAAHWKQVVNAAGIQPQ